jgi:sugar lactone lactonase YvrE
MMTKSRTISRTWRFLCTLLICSIGIASIIGSGSSSGSGSPGGAAPIASINFPPLVSSTDAGQITVTGTASDDSGVASVSVNGLPASSQDGFATWRRAVPLVAGANTLTVSTVDTLGIADASAATAIVNVANDLSGHGTQFADGYAVAFESNRAIVADFENDALVSVDTNTGDSVIISNAMTGAGPAFDGSGGTALVNGLTAALVTNWWTDELLIVDLVSGDRSVVSGSTAGMGPGLFGPIGLALVDATSALITNNAAEELMSVDLTNGNRSVVSALNDRGSGPAFSTPEGVTMDTANNRALVTDSENNSLMAVTLVDGNRTIISANGNPATPEVGTGPNFDYPIGVVLDDANNRALVVNNFSNIIIAVDLANGNRTVFSDTDTNQANGTGPVLNFASGIALDGKDTAFVSGEKLWAVELGSGDRVIVGD